ncbi:MAG: hypothetical protein DMF69_07585 [Acidobacteria bacterium]|nr:MAG: hypothetical protein DMF69_07585 [Acidobacteriota bacterium]
MRKQKDQKSNEAARVKVGNLAQQDKQLKNTEAENIRGGGGAPGGVLGDRDDHNNHKPGQ